MLRFKIYGKNPPERKAPDRYLQPFPNTPQQKSDLKKSLKKINHLTLRCTLGLQLH